ncbi:uncharacterized protein LOC134848513 isoform X2 [Symsagittifera roscoffensis]|uniref:uncharacterized protein LOC134848513 isoform X2 n=1 Tax=Symsagittifera roscoffensis TaxID=84072 RepID=UPI00307C29E1
MRTKLPNMEPEIVSRNQRKPSLDNLLLGDNSPQIPLDNETEPNGGDEMDGGEQEEDFFKLSAQEWQNRTLMPLKEDLAMWISDLLDVEISCQNFFERLQDGVILCKLARHICEHEVQWKGASQATPFKAPINLRSGPFFSRENITNFLRWCKALNINDTCLFESSDLLHLKHLKNIIVCLYAIARRFKNCPTLKLPNLIQLEEEMELNSFLLDNDKDDSYIDSPDVTTTSEHCLSSSTSSCSPQSVLDEFADCQLTRSLCETPEQRRFKPNQTQNTTTPRKSRIPRYSSKLAVSTSKLNISGTGSCSDISEHEGSTIHNQSRSRKSSIPILDKRDGRRPSQTPNRNRESSDNNNNENNKNNKRSKSVDYKKKMFINSMTIRLAKPISDSCDNLDQPPKKDLRRTKFCKPNCSPQSRCCLKQESEPRRKRQRDDDYVIMDLDEEIRRIIKKCKCEDTVTVKKLAEGTYLINDRKVYIRILNRKHVMVRVGGGWQTFEEYLLRHDPTKVSVFARDGVTMLDSTARPPAEQGFLVASGAYRSTAV